MALAPITPRTTLPTNAPRVPEVASWPLNRTTAVTDIDDSQSGGFTDHTSAGDGAADGGSSDTGDDDGGGEGESDGGGDGSADGGGDGRDDGGGDGDEDGGGDGDADGGGDGDKDGGGDGKADGGEVRVAEYTYSSAITRYRLAPLCFSVTYSPTAPEHHSTYGSVSKPSPPR